MKTIFAVAAGVLAATCAGLPAFAQDAPDGAKRGDANYASVALGLGGGDSGGPVLAIAYGRQVGMIALEAELFGLAAVSPPSDDDGPDDYSAGAILANVVLGGNAQSRAKPYVAFGGGVGDAGPGGGFAYQAKAGVVFGKAFSRGTVVEGRVLGVAGEENAVNAALTVGYRFGF